MRDLTTGNVAKRLFTFSMPFLLTTIIQAIISFSDLLIISLFSNKQGSVAGIGIASQLTYLIINAVIGLCIGGSILISQEFGAKKYEDMFKTINTMLTMLIILAIISTIIMHFACNPLLKLLNTPAEAMSEARDYIIYTIIGFILIFVLNGICAVLRGIGDSKKPLIFFFIVAVINIGLNLLAVNVLKMGAKGIGLATVVSHGIGAVISVVYIMKKGRKYNLKKYRFRIDKVKIKNIIKIGLPSAVQNIVASLSFLALTYIIGIAGKDKAIIALAAAGMAFKINSFAVLPARSMSGAIASMVGQNKGAGEKLRIKSTFKNGLLYSLIFGIIFTVLTFFLAEKLLIIFNADNQTIAFGTPFIKAFAFDYIFLPLAVSQYGLTDGLGKTHISMTVNTISSIFLRIPAAYVFGIIFKMELRGIGFAIPLTSLFSAIIMYIYVSKKIWKKLN